MPLLLAAAHLAACAWLLSLAVCWRMGWPLPGTLSWWRPARVWRLLTATLDELSTARHALRALAFTRARARRPVELKDVPFGSHGLLLDVYPPPAAAGGTASGALGPVLWFVYGGAWGSGSRTLYARWGEHLARTHGALVIIADYRLWPRGRLDEMLVDLDEAHGWLRANAARFGADASRLSVVGHSAGAHLLAMWLLRRGVPVERLLSLAGVFDIAEHFEHEAKRGVESISPMHRVMGGRPGFAEASPLTWVREGRPLPALRWELEHGTADRTVPFTSSERMAAALRARGADVVLTPRPGAGHGDLLLPWM